MQQAFKYNITGWVRNRSDGSVEAIFQGGTEELNSMLSLCRNGPPAASVNNIDILRTTPENFPSFRQLPTV